MRPPVHAHNASPLQVCRLSRLYESAPAYVTDQPPFLNAAAMVETVLPPLELLRRLKAIEVGGWVWGGGERRQLGGSLCSRWFRCSRSDDVCQRSDAGECL